MGQSDATYDALVEGMICNFTEASLQSTKRMADLKRYEADILAKDQCDYAHVRPFLRGLKPVPESILELVNLLHFEFGGANLGSLSPDQKAANLLDFFEEPAYVAFAADYSAEMEAYRTDMEGLIYETYGIDPPQPDTSAEATPDTLVVDPVGARPTVPAQKTLGAEPRYTGWVQQLLFWGVLLLMLAVIVYFGYQYYEDREARLDEAKTAGVPQSRSVGASDPHAGTLANMQDQLERQGVMLDNLMKEIDDLHERLSKVMQGTVTTSAVEGKPSVVEATVAVPPPTFPTPKEAGAAFGASPSPDGRGIVAVAESPLLEVEVLETAAKASFQLHPDKTWTPEELANWTTRYPELFKVLNSYEPSASRMATMEEGLAHWHNGQWQVTAKAFVYFK